MRRILTINQEIPASKLVKYEKALKCFAIYLRWDYENLSLQQVIMLRTLQVECIKKRNGNQTSNTNQILSFYSFFFLFLRDT